MSYNLIILRGLPGSGKSTLAMLLAGGNHDLICEADEFMVNDQNNYYFNANVLGYAHGECKNKFRNLIDNKAPTVIVSNTSTQRKEFKDYVKYAEANGYRVTITIVENYHGNKSVHDVPEESMARMRNRFQVNL